jgi:serine acetyltransferase
MVDLEAVAGEHVRLEHGVTLGEFGVKVLVAGVR